MSTRKAEEESKAKKVRKKRKRTHKHKESDARTQSNADGARPTDDTLAPKPSESLTPTPKRPTLNKHSL